MSENYLKEVIASDDSTLELMINGLTPKELREFCRMAILQQDRDTRHACAESISSIQFGTWFASKVSMEIMNCQKGIK